jgi:hypothetical protein
VSLLLKRPITDGYQMVDHLIKLMRRKPLWHNAFSNIALRHSAAPVRESVTWGRPSHIPDVCPHRR